MFGLQREETQDDAAEQQARIGRVPQDRQQHRATGARRVLGGGFLRRGPGDPQLYGEQCGK